MFTFLLEVQLEPYNIIFGQTLIKKSSKTKTLKQILWSLFYLYENAQFRAQYHTYTMKSVADYDILNILYSASRLVFIVFCFIFNSSIVASNAGITFLNLSQCCSKSQALRENPFRLLLKLYDIERFIKDLIMQYTLSHSTELISVFLVQFSLYVQEQIVYSWTSIYYVIKPLPSI